MLEKMGKWVRPHSLLMGLQTGTAAPDISVQNSQKLKRRPTPLHGTSYSTDPCTAVFTAALLTIAGKGKQLMGG